jgi:hypothetical protein
LRWQDDSSKSSQASQASSSSVSYADDEDDVNDSGVANGFKVDWFASALLRRPSMLEGLVNVGEPYQFSKDDLKDREAISRLWNDSVGNHEVDSPPAGDTNEVNGENDLLSSNTNKVNMANLVNKPRHITTFEGIWDEKYEELVEFMMASVAIIAY